MKRSAVYTSLLAGALLVGCGSSSSSGTDGGSTTNLCASIPMNNAPQITDSNISTPYPGGASAATGGTIESGTYFQTQHNYYAPAPASNHTWNAVLAIDASAGTVTSNVSKDGQVIQQYGADFTTNANQLTFKFLCPETVAGVQAPFYYTYSAGTFTIYSDGDKTVTVFQKQ